MTNASRIRLYGTEYCSFCLAARMLLKKKGLEFEDISVSGNDALRQEMERQSGGIKVPQIFIDGKPIGGFDELYAMDKSGELDRLLAAEDSALTQDI